MYLIILTVVVEFQKILNFFQGRDEPNVSCNPSSVSHERLIEAYKYSAANSEITADLHINIYFGGATPKKMEMTGTYSDYTGWVVSRQGAKRNFQLSMAVQRQCPRLYFHISRTGLWIVDQMEAAFAIGSGKEVFLCIEYLNEDTSLHGVRSNNSSGYSSLASTPEDFFHLPAAVTNTSPASTSSASTSSAPSRSSSSSECEEIRSVEFSKLLVTSPENDTVVRTPSMQHRNLLLHTSDVFGLPPCAVKDHNRSRSYLKSLIEETSEECGKGCLLDHPVESISDFIDLL